MKCILFPSVFLANAVLLNGSGLTRQEADNVTQKLLAEQMHWIANDINPALPVFARIRHRQALQKCQVLQKESQSIEVHFEQPQRAVTAGQSIVLYQENYCLGGATITV